MELIHVCLYLCRIFISLRAEQSEQRPPLPAVKLVVAHRPWLGQVFLRVEEGKENCKWERSQVGGL